MWQKPDYAAAVATFSLALEYFIREDRFSVKFWW